MDFAALANYRVKLKESEQRDKYLDLARELKETTEYESDGNRKIGDEWRPSKIQHYGDLQEYWEESWRPEEICCEIPLAKVGVKNFQKTKKIIKEKYAF